MINPAERLEGGRGGPKSGRTKLQPGQSVWMSRRSASVGERELVVAGPAPHSCRRCEDDAAQAPLPAWPASGMTEAHHMTAVAHDVSSNLNAWTGFGIVAGTTATAYVVESRVTIRLSERPLGGNPTGGLFSLVRSPHRSTRESGCATMPLTSSRSVGSLAVANVTVRGDVS